VTPPSTDSRKATGAAFAYVTILFFTWGFATALIDPLIAAVKRVFALSTTEAFLTASAWFIAYGIASLSAAWILARLGYSRSILLSLAVMILGCLIVPLAAVGGWYPGVLIALFVIASGITLLQVAANPLVAALGEGSHFRLVLSQAFNSLGTTIGPWLGAHVLLTGGVFAAGVVVTEAARDQSLHSIGLAFLAMGGLFAIVAIVIFRARKTIADAAPPFSAEPAGPLTALSSSWAVFGALAIFAYVGSEVTVGGMMTNFLSSSEGLGVPIATAGKMVSLYWGGAMVGRFVGSLILTRVPAPYMLIFCTVAAAILCAVVIKIEGAAAAYAALSIGLFNSVMFPTVFALTLERSSAHTSATSGLLIFGITGGAVIPLVAASIADASGRLALAFIAPLVGYGLLTVFALACARRRPHA
jgi:FHS family L-fucose permease-like MFS transporter